MVAFSFAVGGGGAVQIVEVRVPFPIKIGTSPFNTLRGTSMFAPHILKETFNILDAQVKVNDNVVSETFKVSSKKIYFKVS